MASSDLNVDVFSDALSGCNIDLVISGSIAAVESVRFIRSLRRLGAKVTPHLTQGAKQFITSTSVSWAAAKPTIEQFSGTASHIGLGDLCVVAPASINFIAAIEEGKAQTPASALVQSYLGQKKPVYVLTNAHESLLNSPFVQGNIEKLAKHVTFLDPRMEEGKFKFPDPKKLADEIAHNYNQKRHHHWPAVLVAMGTTRGYIDDVRYISNYSSGALGSLITEELYRRGCKTNVIIGPCEVVPASYTHAVNITTNDELESAAQEQLKNHCEGVVFLPSVLDFTPDNKIDGKITSQGKDHLDITLQKKHKILPKLSPKSQLKIGFKLITQDRSDAKEAIAKEYAQSHKLSSLVINQLEDVNRLEHKATIYEFSPKGEILNNSQFKGKQVVAQAIANLVHRHYQQFYDGGQ